MIAFVWYSKFPVGRLSKDLVNIGAVDLVQPSNDVSTMSCI